MSDVSEAPSGDEHAMKVLLENLSTSTTAEIADVIVEQETLLVRAKAEITRLDLVIETVHQTVAPVVTVTIRQGEKTIRDEM